MSAARGLLVGTAALALLEVSVTTGAGRVSGLFSTASSLLANWMSPDKPLIPDRRK